MNEELLDLIHSLFCFKDHPRECKYNTEAQRVDGMDLPDHKYWQLFAKTLLGSCEAETYDDLTARLGEATIIIGKITTRTAVPILAYISAALEAGSPTAFADQLEPLDSPPESCLPKLSESEEL